MSCILKAFSVSTALSFLLASHAYAQEADSNRVVNLLNQEKNPEVFNFSFGVPDSPALSLSGLKASDTTKVDELQDFVVSLPQFYESGKAIAIDFSPANILMPIESYQDTLDFYQNNAGRAYRMLSRTRASVVAQEGKTNADDPSKSVKSLVAFGLTTSVLDRSDPLYAASIDKKDECKKFIDAASNMVGSVRVSSSKPLKSEVSTKLTNANSLLTPHDSANLDQSFKLIMEARDLLKQGNLHFNGEVPKKEFTDLKKSIAEMRKFLDERFPEPKDTKDSYNKSDINAVLEAKKTCYEAVTDALLYTPNLDFGAAALWRGSLEGVNDLHSGGQAIWSSYRHPIRFGDVKAGRSGRHTVLGATARFGFDEYATTGDADTPESQADTMQGWVGVEMFSEKWRAAAQLGYVDVDFKDSSVSSFSRNGEQWKISSDFKVSENFWVGLTYGDAQGTIDALEGKSLSIDLKFSQPKAFNLFGLE